MTQYRDLVPGDIIEATDQVADNVPGGWRAAIYSVGATYGKAHLRMRRAVAPPTQPSTVEWMPVGPTDGPIQADWQSRIRADQWGRGTDWAAVTPIVVGESPLLGLADYRRPSNVLQTTGAPVAMCTPAQAWITPHVDEPCAADWEFRSHGSLGSWSSVRSAVAIGRSVDAGVWGRYEFRKPMPSMYVPLPSDAVIQEGDEYECNPGEWAVTSSLNHGHPVWSLRGDALWRRPITPRAYNLTLYSASPEKILAAMEEVRAQSPSTGPSNWHVGDMYEMLTMGFLKRRMTRLERIAAGLEKDPYAAVTDCGSEFGPDGRRVRAASDPETVATIKALTEREYKMWSGWITAPKLTVFGPIDHEDFV